jgi:hypothetical protein
LLAGSEIPEPQLQLPAGTRTVSPLCAEAIAFCTADCEHEAAGTSAALTGCTVATDPAAISKVNTYTMHFHEWRLRWKIRFPKVSLVSLLRNGLRGNSFLFIGPPIFVSICWSGFAGVDHVKQLELMTSYVAHCPDPLHDGF